MSVTTSPTVAAPLNGYLIPSSLAQKQRNVDDLPPRTDSTASAAITSSVSSPSPRTVNSSNSNSVPHHSQRSHPSSSRLTPSPTTLTPYERLRKPMSVDKFDIDIPPHTSQIESEFTCPLCNRLILHAMTSKVCCHSYCEACITGHLDYVTKYCPLASRTNGTNQQQPAARGNSEQLNTACSAKLPTRRCLRRDEQLDAIISSLFPEKVHERMECARREKDMMEGGAKPAGTSAASTFHRTYSSNSSSNVAVLNDDSTTFNYHRDNDLHYSNKPLSNSGGISSIRLDGKFNPIPSGSGSKRSRKRRVVVDTSPPTSSSEDDSSNGDDKSSSNEFDMRESVKNDDEHAKSRRRKKKVKHTSNAVASSSIFNGTSMQLDEKSPSTSSNDDDTGEFEGDRDDDELNNWKVPKPQDPPTVWDDVDVIVDPSDDATPKKPVAVVDAAMPKELLLIVKLHPKTYSTLKQAQLLSPFLRKQHFIALESACTAADLCRVMYVRKSWCSYVGKFMEQLGWAERLGALPKFENDCWIYADPDGEPLSANTPLATYLSSKPSSSATQQDGRTIYTVYYRPPLDKESMHTSLTKSQQQQKRDLSSRNYDDDDDFSSSSSVAGGNNADDDVDADDVASSANGTTSNETVNDADERRRSKNSKLNKKKKKLLNGARPTGFVNGRSFKKKKRKRMSHFTVKRRR